MDAGRELDLKVHELVFGKTTEDIPFYSSDYEAMSKLRLCIVNQANEDAYDWSGPARQLISRMNNLYDLQPLEFCEALVRIYTLKERYARAPGHSDAEREARYQNGIAKIKAELFKRNSMESYGAKILHQYNYSVDEEGFKFGGFKFLVNKHEIYVSNSRGRLFNMHLKDDNGVILQKLDDLDFKYIDVTFDCMVQMAYGRLK